MRQEEARAVLLTAIVAAPLGAAAEDVEPKPDEMVNNPPHAYWSAFHPGTTVTQKETVTLADGTKIETTAVSKLVEANKQQVVVETRVPAEGEASETVTDVYAATVKMSEVDSPASAAKVTEGKEEVEVKGKKMEAEWVESTIEDGDDTWIEKVWTARDVPGGVVKETLVHKQGNAVQSTSVTELVDFKVVS
jgi:hypothetical protein